jgi:hypothetical protein
MESDMEPPAFTPMTMGPEYCVLVTWTNGAVARISHFARLHDAQRWIANESRSWLRIQDEPNCRAAHASEGLATIQEPRIRMLQRG